MHPELRRNQPLGDLQSSSTDIRLMLGFLHLQQMVAIGGLTRNKEPIPAKYFAGHEHDLAAAHAAALSDSRTMEAVWVKVNPVDPARQPAYPSDKDIPRRTNLFFDFDWMKVRARIEMTRRVRERVERALRVAAPEPLDEDELQSSSEMQHDLALFMASRFATSIMRWCKQHKFPRPASLITSSGNGGHVFFKTDLPTDEATNELVREVYRLLHRGRPSLDCSTSNASAWTKLTGTAARKGKDTADHPHRVTRFIRAQGGAAVSRQMLEALRDYLRAKRQSATRQSSSSEPAKHTANLADDAGIFKEPAAPRTVKELAGMLPPAAYAFWKFGTHAKNSRSEMVRSLTLSAIAQGWSWAEYQAVMTDPAALGTARIREKDHPEKHLAGEWKRAHAYAAAHPPARPAPDQKILDALNRAKYSVKSIKWTGRTGSRNAKVLLAHLHKALEWGDFRYPASVRKLAQIAGVSLLTAYAACLELVELGYLSKLDQTGIDYPAARGSSRIIRDRQTTWWQININVIYNSSPHRPVNEEDVWRSVIVIDQSHDAFHHWCLGATGYRVLSALDFVQGVTIKELAERLAMRPQLVKRKLRQLESHGIAKLIGKSDWHLGSFEPGSTPKLLDRVAAAARTLGRGERRENWYRDERAKQQGKLARINEQAFARRKQWQEAAFAKRPKNH